MKKTKALYTLRHSIFDIRYSIFIFSCCCLHAQTQPCDTLPVQRSIPVAARYAATDNLSNIYVVTSKNTVEKFDSSGRKVASYSNNRFGSLYRIDASIRSKFCSGTAIFKP